MCRLQARLSHYCLLSLWKVGVCLKNVQWLEGQGICIKLEMDLFRHKMLFLHACTESTQVSACRNWCDACTCFFFFPQIVTTSQYFQQIEHETDIPFCGSFIFLTNVFMIYWNVLFNFLITLAILSLRYLGFFWLS